MRRRRRNAKPNPVPLVAWGALALLGAAGIGGAGLWFKSEADVEADRLRRKLEAEGKGTITPTLPPAPPAPQTIEDMRGGWTPAKLQEAAKAQYLEWIEGAPRWVSWGEWAPGELGAPDNTLLYVGIAAAGVGTLLLLTGRR